MSTKRPDVIRKPPSSQEALTLAEMHVAGWQLRAGCPRCSTAYKVNVGSLIKAYGPDTIWWGVHPACPKWDCAGKLTYMARSIGGGSWTSLGAAPPAREVQLWKDKASRRFLEPRD
jgi:hypothetical protein